MKAFVLILMLWNGAQSAAITTHTFYGEDACIFAGKMATKTWGTQARYVCVPQNGTVK